MAGDQLISMLEGNTFVVSDRRGDIDASPTDTMGLFSRDTRFLSRWRLTVDGTVPNVLSTDDLQYFSAQFFLVPSTETVYVDANLSIIRTRAVGDGFHEDLTILNLSAQQADLGVRIEAGADFADLFAVKDNISQSGEHYTRVEPGRLVLGYRRGYFFRWKKNSASPPQTDLYASGLSLTVHTSPHGELCTSIKSVTTSARLGEVDR